MSDVLNGVSVFVTAAESGGFSAAAAKLHLSRSAVGKTIARLESRLGVRLFHRTTRAQSLTEDGEAYLEHCMRALDALRAGGQLLESGRREASGRLRVTVPMLFGRRCVAPILNRLAAQHPKLEIEFNFTDQVVDLIEDRFDLAIRNGRPDGRPLPGTGVGLKARKLALQRMTVCAAPAYLAEHGTPLALEELRQYPALVYGRNGTAKAWSFPQEGGAPLEILPPNRLRFDDLGAIADAAIDGLGMAWLPCWLIRDAVRASKLVPLLTGEPRQVFESYALWLNTPHLPLRLRLAIDALAAELPGNAEL
jgi:DNA-binding transcriptional LysR family regulator